jgi:carbamoyl-phosphate synthase small subunit
VCGSHSNSHVEIPANELPYHVITILAEHCMLVARGCRPTVVPAQTPQPKCWHSDGVLLFTVQIRQK